MIYVEVSRFIFCKFLESLNIGGYYYSNFYGKSWPHTPKINLIIIYDTFLSATYYFYFFLWMDMKSYYFNYLKKIKFDYYIYLSSKMIYPFIYSAERDNSQATSPFLLKDHLVSTKP